MRNAVVVLPSAASNPLHFLCDVLSLDIITIRSIFAIQLMPVGSATSQIVLAITLVLFSEVVLGISPSDFPVAVWIESPKQHENVYYYLSDNPTFNATVRLHRRPGSAVGALSLNVFFQGALVAEVAAESDVVLNPR